MELMICGPATITKAIGTILRSVIGPFPLGSSGPYRPSVRANEAQIGRNDWTVFQTAAVVRSATLPTARGAEARVGPVPRSDFWHHGSTS
jgi:hypothetical protein